MKLHFFCAALACAAVCLADIPPPPPAGRPAALEIRQAESSTVVLRIPSDLPPPAARAETLDHDAARIRGAVAGLLLSLSIIGAGILLVRWRQARTAAAALALCSVAALAGAGYALADIGPPHKPYFDPRRTQSRPAPAGAFDPGTLVELGKVVSYEHGLSGRVSVEIGPAGSPVTLIVPGPRRPRFVPGPR